MKQTALVLVLLLPLVMSCKNEPQPQNKIVVALFDLSLSTQTEEIHRSYMRDMRKVMDTMNGGDVLVAARITEKSISELEFCLQHTFDRFEPETNNTLTVKALRMSFEKSRAAIRDSLLALVDSTLQSRPRILKTEIMGALQVAGRIFHSYEQPKKVLVIFSDMLEDSQFYRFDREKLSAQRIQAIIKNETDNLRMPELDNVRVYVTGARSADRKRFLAVQDFWIKYFEKAGANLSPDDYGSILIRFEE